MNKQIGADIRMEITPMADYAAKFSSVMAGNDLPDLVQIPAYFRLPRLPDLLHSRFADLSDHLSGDKVRTYPNLANLPTVSWRNARIAGRIFGVPLARPTFAQPMLYRADIFAEAGLQPPQSAADFTALCKELTNEKAGRWALGSYANNGFGMDYVAQMFGVPRKWHKKADGTLVRSVETEEYMEALAYMRGLWKAGYFHPDSASASTVQAKELFAGGRFVMYTDGLPAWRAAYSDYVPQNPGMKVMALDACPAEPGGKVVQYAERGVFSITAIKKADTGRVEELLRILDFLAAPFGSREWQVRANGVENVDYTRQKNGSLEPTDQGKRELTTPFSFIMDGPPSLYHPRYTEWVQAQHAWETRAARHSVADPTIGIYSETEARQGDLEQLLSESSTSIITGRSSVASFKDTLRQWQERGGNKIRTELEEGLRRQ
ncbi:extracellular solute-binding protein [Streptomyces sp. NPDC056405]|uniref:extracellular solute-binding protein n=1 Tax=Streptomyces sp. NPDC056405 TaxID=3345811 RepID=UPI0035E265EB